MKHDLVQFSLITSYYKFPQKKEFCGNFTNCKTFPVFQNRRISPLLTSNARRPKWTRATGGNTLASESL